VTHSPERQCIGKVKFKTKGRAKAACSRLLRLGMIAEPAIFGVYRCGHCGRFHLGHARYREATREVA
jgi:hypothetical protein